MNNGGQDYSCLAKLEEMARTDGTAFKNAFLPIGLRTQHQRLQQRAGGRFNLRMGESKLIEVVWLNERESDSELVLHYESDTYPNCVPRADYSITVSVYGGGRPATGTYRIYVDARGYLKMVEASR